ncbi:biotin/lipoyl-containing protein [Neobacillus niacini]|uniref:biotin/lipoyl-containing protein n=1 Tax=Neobacillus niacini TaxID=86668 RepID=UPI003000895C
MVKMLELREMIRLVSKSSIQEFYLKNNGVSISMKKPIPIMVETIVPVTPQETFHAAYHEAAAAIADKDQETKQSIPKDSEKESNLYKIVSPFIGVFSSPKLKAGDRITEGTLVGTCNIEELRLTHEILSDVVGEIVEVLVKEGEIVEYGQPLIVVKPVSGGTQ